MPSRFVIIALLAVSQVSLAQKSITFSWQPGISQGWQPCTSGNYCLTGFTLSEITTGIPVTIANIPQTTLTYNMSPLPSRGSHSYQLAQNGIDGTGTAVQSQGNPGVVINCTKFWWGRTCSVGKHWGAVAKLIHAAFIRPRAEVVVPPGMLGAEVNR
jgi:hypothetical protein